MRAFLNVRRPFKQTRVEGRHQPAVSHFIFLLCGFTLFHGLSHLTIEWLRQGILNGEVSVYRWPPVWLVRNQLYDYWQFLFLVAKQTNPNQLNRRSMVQWYFSFWYSLVEGLGPALAGIDLKRITRCNLGIVRVCHFWKCYGSEQSKSQISRSFEVLEIIAFYPFKEKTTHDNSVTEITLEFSISHRKKFKI